MVVDLSLFLNRGRVDGEVVFAAMAIDRRVTQHSKEVRSDARRRPESFVERSTEAFEDVDDEILGVTPAHEVGGKPDSFGPMCGHEFRVGIPIAEPDSPQERSLVLSALR